MKTKMNWAAWPAALLLTAGLHTACGDDEDEPTTGGTTGDMNGDMNGDMSGDMNGDMNGDMGDMRTVDLTLVTILAVDDSDPIGESHNIDILDADTGELLEPPGRVTSESGTGKIVFQVPQDQAINLHVMGSGPDSDDTYDLIALNDDANNGETLLRISNVGLSALAENTAAYEGMPDKAALGGAIYLRPNGGPRVGTVGCAQVFIDDDTTGVNDAIAQRYNGPSGLPTTLTEQTRTNSSGRFFLGNIEPGVHTARVSMDGGQTFIGEPTEFRITAAREDALGEAKLIIYTLAVDLDMTTAPAIPDGTECPPDE